MSQGPVSCRMSIFILCFDDNTILAALTCSISCVFRASTQFPHFFKIILREIFLKVSHKLVFSYQLLRKFP